MVRGNLTMLTVSACLAPCALRIMARSRFGKRSGGCEWPFITLMIRVSVGVRGGKRLSSEYLSTRMNV